MSDSLAQLHRTLVDAIRRTRPTALNRPVTVAEIYQDLVPYKTARSEIGFDMNADYEHALLRLLAGEGNLARIEPREVRDKLRMELESPNPDVGMFRNYAACDVWVNVGENDDEAGEADVMDALGEPASWEDEFLGEERTQPANTPFEIAHDVAPPASAPEPVKTPAAGSKKTTVECAFCGGELPEDRMVNFCPFCGSDQSQQPCPSCGELLDPLWRFCVSCGTRTRPLDDHVN
jgi:hypothetical protein